jgi:hypothetical protein
MAETFVKVAASRFIVLDKAVSCRRTDHGKLSTFGAALDLIRTLFMPHIFTHQLLNIGRELYAPKLILVALISFLLRLSKSIAAQPCIPMNF